MSPSASLQNTAAKSSPVSNLPNAGLLLQRKCACGGLASSSLAGECEECKNKRLQKKLSIGASNDPLEHEADRVADQVLAAPAHSAVSETTPRIQRFTGQAREGAATAPASVDRVLSNSGRLLDPALQQDMGQRFGYDFSQVRVHTGAAAEQSARDVNANAYTVGNNVVFGAERFAPGSQEGRRLLAHELTHVLQQSGTDGMRTNSGHKIQGWSAAITPLLQSSPVVAREKPKNGPTKEEIEKSKKQRDAIALFWSDMHEHFSGEARKLAGSAYDDTVAYLRTNFQEGDSMEGGVKTSRSAPEVYVGKKYLSEPDKEKRKAAITAELVKIDEFRFDKARIDNDDLSNSVITGKIASLDVFGKRDYLQKLDAQQFIKNDKVKEHIRKSMPSTSLEVGAVATNEGGFTLQFQNIKIVVKPDVFNSSEVAADEAHTELKRIDSEAYKTKPGFNWGQDQKVSSMGFTPSVPQLIYKVETHYGPQSDPSFSSGYGVGTRPEDSTGNKLIRFHEGTHGTVFIQFIKDNISKNSFPVFDGKLGDNKDDFGKKVDVYERKVLAFDQMLKDAVDASEQQVDCVGKTIEQYHTEKGTTSKLKCKKPNK